MDLKINPCELKDCRAHVRAVQWGVQSPDWSHLCFSTASSSSSSSSSDFLSCAKLKEQLAEGTHGKMSSRRTDWLCLTASDPQPHAHDLCKSTVEAKVHKSCSWSKRNSASPALRIVVILWLDIKKQFMKKLNLLYFCRDVEVLNLLKLRCLM